MTLSDSDRERGKQTRGGLTHSSPSAEIYSDVITSSTLNHYRFKWQPLKYQS